MLKFGFRKYFNKIILAAAFCILAAGAGCVIAAGMMQPKAVPAAGFHEGVSSAAAVSAAGSRMIASSAAVSSAPAKSSVTKPKTGKTVYMTFDDGPSNLTVPLLNILDRYHVKATFFVVGANDKNETADLQEIVKRGHVVGVHSYTHDYRKIYASTGAFFQDFDKMHSMILQATGVNARICRFPGGSINAYNRRTYKAIIAGLKRRGYVYYDWNASSGDATNKTNGQKILNDSLKGVRSHKVSVVLFHNSATKRDTLNQISRFIETLQKEGYSFATLDPSVDNKPFVFGR